LIMPFAPPYTVRFKFLKGAVPDGVHLSIETPKLGDIVAGLVIEVAGWVAQDKSSMMPPPLGVAIYANGEEWLTAPIEMLRPDVRDGMRSRLGIELTSVLNGFSLLLPVHLAVSSQPYQLFVLHGPNRNPAYAVAEISFEAVDSFKNRWLLSDPIQPVIVNSLGRSGSSLICRMLAADKRFHVAQSMNQFGELQVLGFITRMMAVLASQGSLAELNRPELRPDFYDVAAPSFCSPLLQQQPSGWDSDLSFTMTQQVYQFARTVILEHIGQIRQRSPQVEFLVEKTWNSLNVNLVRLLFPSMREVFVVRHPRAFWASQLAFHKKLQASPHVTLVHQESTADRLVGLARAWRDRKDISYLLRYEDLVDRPRESLAGLASYLGLPAGDALIEIAASMVGDDSDHAQMLKTNLQGEEIEFDQYYSALDPHTQQQIAHDSEAWGYALNR
jgi:hypothetical protein